MKKWIWGAALSAALLWMSPAQAVDIERYIKDDSFGTIKISPTGGYFAATVPMDDGSRTALVIMRRGDNAVTGTFVLERNTHVENFWWVNDERVLIGISEKFGLLEQPSLTGELYAMNADGTGVELLVGQRVRGRGLGTRIQPKKVERVAAFLVDTLRNDDRHVIISVSPFHADAFTEAERLDVYSGRRHPVASAPVRNASFVTDNQGVVRYAVGEGVDRLQKVYYRAGEGAKWELVNDEATNGLRHFPVGFAADDRTAYLEAQRANGPNVLVAHDIATGQRTEVLGDDSVDPGEIIYRHGSLEPVGVFLLDGKPRTEFFQPGSEEARMYRSLEAAFGGVPVKITSRTSDGRIALVQTWSDRNPGDFFLFDTVDKKADHLLSRRAWFDPATMAAKKPVTIPARDGLALHGYLTVPTGSTGKSLPAVVVPHGGPFGVRDRWGFESGVQMLAEAGYAVLQVNFRGSGGYGKAFSSAGARQWGQAMQDDLTDATRWLIDEGVAAADRICIHGSSYGGYAALMGAVREPDLYRCASGNIGVYDLPTMHTAGDVQERGSGETFLREWVGGRDEVAAHSPTRLAERIRVPVFLAAGEEDERAPVQHTRMMERALRDADVPVEALYFKNEGHGYYLPENRRKYYTALLDFLARHLGGDRAAGGGNNVAAD
ncbi:peptidase S9 [Lysobacter arseniciresistens ZS79]|uniref:Peptidase S9 n=1 Tax=Lysobacter arseniciresistens ZS79 TaxID=913325 RepID=A0A0A0F170_9GAMM|nr:S9 family peptidase [Lysobacter arseniciresistens]KGM56881.1 peptidase S9 [Lysobacter arseniciresistens ZS79]